MRRPMEVSFYNLQLHRNNKVYMHWYICINTLSKYTKISQQFVQYFIDRSVFKGFINKDCITLHSIIIIPSKCRSLHQFFYFVTMLSEKKLFVLLQIFHGRGEALNQQTLLCILSCSHLPLSECLTRLQVQVKNNYLFKIYIQIKSSLQTEV